MRLTETDVHVYIPGTINPFCISAGLKITLPLDEMLRALAKTLTYDKMGIKAGLDVQVHVPNEGSRLEKHC